MPLRMFYLVLVFSLNVLLPSSAHAELPADFCDKSEQIPREQCETLVRFYNETDGDRWNTFTGPARWGSDQPCEWRGVGCSQPRWLRTPVTAANSAGMVNVALHVMDSSAGKNGLISVRVVEVLNFSGLPIAAALPDLSGLDTLDELILTGCQMRGPLPDASRLPPKLRVLGLSENSFTGELPARLPASLTKLILGKNLLEGSIQAVTGLKKLQVLSLRDNRFQVNSLDLSALPRLHHLDLSGNPLSGEALLSLNAMPRLRTVLLSRCGLRGGIPELSDLPELRELYLDRNHLSGPLPDLSKLPQLETLNLSSNQLSGHLPDLSALSQLVTLNLSNNQLTGLLPDLAALSLLETANFSNNQLDGISALSGAGRLKTLNLSDNRLSGPVPPSNGLQNLQELFLQNNLLEGPLPELKLPYLRTLLLQNNRLSGPLPDLNTLPELRKLDASNNVLSGPLPVFEHTLKLQEMSLYHNQIEGPLPRLDALSQLRRLTLAGNRLSGPLPPLALEELTHLDLSHNQISGELPEMRAMKLDVLNISHNQLQGQIPPLDGMRSLRELDLSNNRLEGPLPSSLNRLVLLNSLDLTNNRLSGSLPSLSHLVNLETLQLGFNQLDGNLAELEGLTRLRRLGLSGNPLAEKRTPELTRLLQRNLMFISLGEAACKEFEAEKVLNPQPGQLIVCGTRVLNAAQVIHNPVMTLHRAESGGYIVPGEAPIAVPNGQAGQTMRGIPDAQPVVVERAVVEMHGSQGGYTVRRPLPFMRPPSGVNSSQQPRSVP